MMTEPRVYVAGATGFTGRALVRVLREQNVRVMAHVRPDSPQREVWKGRFEELGAELSFAPWEGPALAAELARWAPTHVFCLVGTTRHRARKPSGSAIPENYDAVDYGLTARLVDACRDLSQAPRVVLLSALGTGPRARGAYYEARWRAEQAVRSAGLPFTIVRASFISGPGRDEPRPLERLAAGVADAALRALAGVGARRLHARYAAMTPEQLAQGLVRVAFDDTSLNATLEPEALA